MKSENIPKLEFLVSIQTVKWKLQGNPNELSLFETWELYLRVRYSNRAKEGHYGRKNPGSKEAPALGFTTGKWWTKIQLRFLTTKPTLSLYCIHKVPHCWSHKHSRQQQGSHWAGSFSEMFPLLSVHRRHVIGWAVLEDTAQQRNWSWQPKLHLLWESPVRGTTDTAAQSQKWVLFYPSGLERWD